MPCLQPDGLHTTLVSVQTENQLRTLERLRDRISQEIDSTSSLHNLERLSARLQSVMAEIDELLPTTEESPADKIAARRRARRKGSGASQSG